MIRSLVSDTRIRFLLAGGSAALLNWLVRFPLNVVLPYPAAVAVALGIGMAYGFLVYRGWAFGSSGRRSIVAELRDFLVVNAAGAIVTIGVAVAVVAVISRLPPLQPFAEGFAHALGIFCGAVVNYVGHKRLTFRL